jgi:FixJ family two-component response regulator
MANPLVQIVDDDGSVRTALARVLRVAGYDVRSYESAAEFLIASHDEKPGCIVLDVGMPGMSGIELQAAIAKGESTPIVFLTGRGTIETSVRAMKAGAVDFLTKPVKRETLLAAVRAAVERDEAQRAKHDELRGLRARLETLTPREGEVLALVVRGKLNKQIADALGTSIRTVKAHRAQVMSKLRAGSLAELVSLADRLGILTHG